MGPPLGGLPWHRGSRFPRSAREPAPGSRRLHAGHHSGSRQAPPELHPGPTTGVRFRWRPYAFDISSAVHFRSSSQRLPDGFIPPFPGHAHHPGHWAGAASGGLGPGPATRARGTCPHLSAARLLQAALRAPFRAIVAHSHRHTRMGMKTERPRRLSFARFSCARSQSRRGRCEGGSGGRGPRPLEGQGPW